MLLILVKNVKVMEILQIIIVKNAIMILILLMITFK